VVDAFLAAGVPAPYMIGECVADVRLRRVAGTTLKVAGWEHSL
jgi:uncharacterized membrane protein AbrB (regulator of aidB expression)